jgi:hypothetical protein
LKDAQIAQGYTTKNLLLAENKTSRLAAPQHEIHALAVRRDLHFPQKTVI